MAQALSNTKPGVWPAEPIDPYRPFKSMTRRVVKPQPDKDDPCVEYLYDNFPAKQEYAEEIWAKIRELKSIRLKPRYQKGDILWVRETWQENTMTSEKDKQDMPYFYRADPDGVLLRSWCSPIFMPRKAARLFLEVKDVRLERVRDITNADVMAEGINENECQQKCEEALQNGLCNLTSLADLTKTEDCYDCDLTKKKNYERLWNHLNAKRGYPWERNPWVWVYEFMMVKP
jgi:hypothetical protein